MVKTRIVVSDEDTHANVWCIFEHRFRVFTFKALAGGGLYKPFGWFSVPIYMGSLDHADY